METNIDVTGAGELYAVLLRYSRSLTSSPWDAQDLAQDVWVKATASSAGVGHPNPEALLLRIAKTTWIDHCRRQQRFTRLLRSGALESAAKEGELLWTLEEMFAAVLKALTGKQRSVWLLADVLDHSIRETAELLRMSEGAVKSALHRARQMLDTVRRELTLAVPEQQDTHTRKRLELLSAAYRSGNVAALLQLLQEEAHLHQTKAPASAERASRNFVRPDRLPGRRSPFRSSTRCAA